MSSSTVIGIPTDEKVFESSCIPLFAGLLGDPNVKLIGTRGKKQFGLDLIGRRDRDPSQPVGIQCKLITRGGKLAETVVRSEVAQALLVKPPLTEFYIVTTATDEPALDFLATELSQQQAAGGRKIDIQVWGWDTLQEKIRADAKALAAFDPGYSPATDRLIALGEETLHGQSAIRAQNERAFESIEIIRASITASPIDTARSALEQHLDAQVDQYRDLMNAGKPRTALGLFESLEATFDTSSSAAIRARVKANIAIATMRLGDDARGAALLSEAYQLNPADPRTRANNILALLMMGDVEGGWAFAKQVLQEDPSNAGAASLAFQAAMMAKDERDPFEIVPTSLLDDLNVRIQRISYLREKDSGEDWWQLAAETLERFPDEGIAVRMAGDALIDEGLRDNILADRGNLPDERRIKLREGAALLQRHWDDVRHFENAAERNWIMVAFNLITAYRALGDLANARTVSDQMVALDSDDPDALVAAALTAIDQDNFRKALTFLEQCVDYPPATLHLLVAHSNLQDFPAVLSLGTAERREALASDDRQLFDVLLFRAKHAADPDFDLDAEVENLLAEWPLGVAAHIATADIYRRDKPSSVAAMAARAKSLVTDETSFSDRVMFAQLSLFRHNWDDIIFALDGYVEVVRHSEPLIWLAMAFANAPPQLRTSPFFQSLGPDVIGQSQYARFAGAAEHNRGDLKAAERYLQQAVAADPQDLRSALVLASSLARDNRESDAASILAALDDERVEGSPEDLMRLAHNHRRAGESERALKLGYRTAAAHRQIEGVVSSYPGLIFMDDRLPTPIGQAGPAQEGFWFDIEGLDGARDVSGVIDRVEIPGVTTFKPEHPISAALLGKSAGDVISLPAELGADRQYRVRELKHKYIWLLHDILATHAALFPTAGSMFEMTMKDGDVQPVLDMVRSLQEKDDFIAGTYSDHPVPLAAVAAMAKKSVLALAEHLVSTDTNLRTCVGSTEERSEAAAFVRGARRKGVVLDTLTVWQLRELGQLSAAKNYFGRLCIPRSAFDDIIELRAKIEGNRGREYMTLGFEGDQAVRQVHSPEDTERRLAWVNEVIADFEANCEILPVDGELDTRLHKMIGASAASQIFDPINLARSTGLILISEDLNLRQFAAQHGVVGGAWLQITLHVLAADGAVPQSDYLISVGMLGAMHHGHLWLDAATVVGILTLDDPQAFALFEAAIRFMGGRNAEMKSHLSVTLDFMQGIWWSSLPDWQKGRAIGRLLEQLMRSRPDDWKPMLHVIDAELAKPANRGDIVAGRARDYLTGWMLGHFLDVLEIRSGERIFQALKLPKSVKRKRNRRKRPSIDRGR